MTKTTALAILGLGLAGCASCEEVTVTLELAEEEVRSLPVLQSGKPLLAGISTPLPDSHGRFFLRVGVEGAQSVDVAGLRYSVTVGGQPLEVKQVRSKASRGDVEAPKLPGDGDLVDGDVLELWWKARALAQLQLAADAPVTLSVTLDWTEAAVGGQSGTAELEVPDSVVRTVVDTGAFRAGEASGFRAVPGDGKAELRGLFENAAGIRVDVRAVAAKVVFYGAGDLDLGAALFTGDQMARQVGSREAGAVAHDEALTAYTSDSPRGDSPEPGPSGTAVRTGNLASGKAIALFDIEYATDESPGLSRSEVAAAIDLPR